MKPTQEQVADYREYLSRCSQRVAMARVLVDAGGSVADSLNTVREFEGLPWKDHRGQVVLGVGLCGKEEREFLSALSPAPGAGAEGG